MSSVGISLALDHLNVAADADVAAMTASDSNANLNFIQTPLDKVRTELYYAQSCRFVQRGFPGLATILGSAI
jgi:hypothetical protein